MNFFKDHLNLSNNIYDNAQILKAAEIKKQQKVVDCNPTTKYYQTLALNLQEQVQYLKRMLNEETVLAQGVSQDMTPFQRFEVGHMQTQGDNGPQQTNDPNRPKPVPAGQRFPIKGKNPYKPGTDAYRGWERNWHLQNWHAENPYPYATPEWFTWEMSGGLGRSITPNIANPRIPNIGMGY